MGRGESCLKMGMANMWNNWIKRYAAQVNATYVASEELAQNGHATRGRCGRVSEMFGAAIGGLCASDSLIAGRPTARGCSGSWRPSRSAVHGKSLRAYRHDGLLGRIRHRGLALPHGHTP